MARGRTIRVDERLSFAGALSFAILGALAYAAPVGLPGMDLPMPWLPLAPIFFWGLLRPDLSRGIAAFLVGLFQDFASGGPLGVWALTYLVMFAVITPQRDALEGQPPSAVWIGFAVFVLMAAVVAYGAGWLASQFRPPLDVEGLGLDPSVTLERDIRPGPAVTPLVQEAVFTVLIGPIAARALGGFARIGAMSSGPAGRAA